MIRYWNYILLAAMMTLFAACAANKAYQIELMPAPELYTTGPGRPF
jgi:hypothetical protein